MILIVLLILVLAAGGCLLAIRKEINGSASAGKTVSVSIQQGSGVAAIAQKLKTAGVIKYPHVFRWYAGKQGAAGKLQYGEFDLAPGSSYDDIIEALSAYAKADSVRLTFPEGTTAIAIAKKMEDAGCAAPRTSSRRPTLAISASTGSGSTSPTTRTPRTASSSARVIFSRIPTIS